MWKLLSRAGRGSSGYPQRECFFCRTSSVILPPYKPDDPNSDSTNSSSSSQLHPSTIATSSNTTISTGTPLNWFCSSCHCQNVTTKDGAPVEQYTRPMWDAEWNQHRSQLLRHTRPKASRPSAPSLTTEIGGERLDFCHACRTNQVLTLNMLADYLPAEDDPEYRSKLEGLEEYEASIRARYPAVCGECAPKVQEKIEERDRFARSWSLGRWLEIKKKASSGELGGETTSAVNKSATTPSTPTNGEAAHHARKSFSHRLLSLVHPSSSFIMAIFVLVSASLWSLYLTTYLYPAAVRSNLHQAAKRIQAEPFSLFTAAFASSTFLLLPLLLVLCSRMDPLKRSIESARARQIRVQVSGLPAWRTTQYVVVALRLFTLSVGAKAVFEPAAFARGVSTFEAATGMDSSALISRAAATLLISEIILTGLAASQLRVRSPTPLQLVSRPVAAEGDGASDALLTGLSLDDGAPRMGFAQTSLIRTESSHSEVLTPVTRDADGDAVMEDATAYAARRRMSVSSEDEELDHHPAPPAPSSVWSSTWSKPAQTQTFSSTNRIAPDFQLGPQRFWEPQHPTGLEDVFGRAVSLADDESTPSSSEGRRQWSKWFGFS